MKTKLLLVILMLTLLCGGCDILKKKPITNKPDFNIQEDIKNAKNTINTSTKTIEKASKNITTEANKINKETIEVQRIVPEDNGFSVDFGQEVGFNEPFTLRFNWMAIG